MSSRRSRGLDVTIVSTRPCETTECISLPRPVSLQDLEHVDEAAARAVEAVLALAGAVEAAQDRDLAHRHVDGAVAVVDDDLDLGRRARLHAAAAAEDDVAHRLAADGERRLLAHRPQHGVGDVRLARAVRADDDGDARAEVELRAVGEGLEALEGQRLEVHRLRPGSHSSSSSGGPARPDAASRAQFARLPARRASSSGPLRGRPARPPTVATTSNVRSCGGPSSAATSYSTVSRAAREALLQRRLEVDRVRQRVGDLRLEGLDDGRGRALVAVVQVAGADHGLDDRGQHALGLDERLDALADARRRRRAQQVGHAEALGDRAAGDARHALRADLRQPPRAEALGLQARVEVRRHREAEDGVAEERQARVGVRAALGPGGVREDLPVQMLAAALRGVR